MWEIEWWDKRGERQSKIVETKKRAELILDYLESHGLKCSVNWKG